MWIYILNQYITVMQSTLKTLQTSDGYLIHFLKIHKVGNLYNCVICMDVVFRPWAHSWQLCGLKYILLYIDLWKFLSGQLLRNLNAKYIKRRNKTQNFESKFNLLWENTDKRMVDTSPNAFRGGCCHLRGQLVSYKVQSSVQGSLMQT